MNRDVSEERLVAYLYDEVDEKERGEIEAWLAGSPEARARLEALQRTRAVLRQWPDEEPGAPILFVQEKTTWREGWRRLVTPGRAVAAGFAAAAAVVLMFANVSVGVREGAFHFEASWRGNEPAVVATRTAGDSLLTVREFAAVQKEYFGLIQQMVEASEMRQQETLARAVLQIEGQRQDDLNILTQGMADVGRVAVQGCQQSGILLDHVVNAGLR